MQSCGKRQRLVSSNYWKLLVPKHLHDLPRLPDVMKAILMEPDITLEIQPSLGLASKVLQNAQRVLHDLPKQSCFKIGQTSHPVHRWGNIDYGYKHSRQTQWRTLKIIAVVAHGETAGFVEATLISAWCSDIRCLNVAGGGEGISRQEGPFFIYAVVSHPAPLPSLGHC